MISEQEKRNKQKIQKLQERWELFQAVALKRHLQTTPTPNTGKYEAEMDKAERTKLDNPFPSSVFPQKG